MAREARIVLPGVAHHVTQRGNYQQDIFVTDEDRVTYLDYLRQSSARFGLRVSAYCLMTNHVHLLVTPQTKTSLAKALGRAHLMYAQYMNRAHDKIGHLWQGRFYSCPLDDASAHNAALYIELNPVRAKIVRAPWRYHWSSAAAHSGMQIDASGLLVRDAWMKGYTPKKWKAALETGLNINDAQNLLEHTRTGRPMGGERFLETTEKRLKRDVRAPGRGRPKGSKDSYKRIRKHSEE